MQRQPAPRFAILGGSFNPVHIGHVALARALAGLPGIAQVLAIPAARNPFKRGEELLPARTRWEMVRAAFADLRRVAVLDVELRRAPPSYTMDTVCDLRSLYPQAELALALGWDAFRDFSEWHAPGRLLEQAGLIVVPRAGRSAAGEGEGEDVALRFLPADWAERLVKSAPGEWRDETGRQVLTLVPLELPEVSATRIWAERRWELVPEPARELLLRHLSGR